MCMSNFQKQKDGHKIQQKKIHMWTDSWTDGEMYGHTISYFHETTILTNTTNNVSPYIHISPIKNYEPSCIQHPTIIEPMLHEILTRGTSNTAASTELEIAQGHHESLSEVGDMGKKS